MRTKNLFITFYFFAIVGNAKAQQLIFQKTYGDTLGEAAYDLKKTFDGGYILAGLQSPTTFFHPDVYLIKTDSAGNLQWKKSIGGTEEDYGISIVQNPDSGFSIVGFTVQVLRTNSDF